MQIKGRLKSGMISIELALGIFASIVVLFVVFSNLSDSMNKIAMNSNINNLTQTNEAKTAYVGYGRDYKNSDTCVK